MRVGDVQIGAPERPYRGNKATLEALTGILEDSIAVSTDTKEIGIANGDDTWTWIGFSSGTVDSVNGKTGVVVLDPDDLDDSGTGNKFTSAAEILKLAGIEAGAEVNVQADWNQSDDTQDDYIRNKPTIPGSGGKAIYGDGHDGAAVLDGVNTFPWASLSGSTYTLLRDIYLTTLQVNVSIILVTASYRIFCNTSLTNDGTIHNNGANAPSNIAGAGNPDGFYLVGNAGGGGVASGAAANAGADGSGGGNGSILGGFGGRGAAGWVSAITHLPGEGINSTVGNVFPTLANGGINLRTRLETFINKYNNPLSTSLIQMMGGTGGGGGSKSAVGTSCASGGGGGAGGLALLCALLITNTGTISCNGGNGANATGTGANAGGGGGGGGGVLFLVYDTLNNTGTIQANGGLGGTSVAGGTTPKRAVARSLGSWAKSGFTASASNITRGPNKNTLYLAATLSTSGGTSAPTISGWGLTWNQIATVSFNTIASPTYTLTLFQAYGTPVITDDTKIVKATWAFSGNGTLVIDEICNAVNTIVQNNNNRTNSATTLAVTLSSAISNTDNAVYAVFGFSAGSARVAGAGFVKITDVTSGAQMTSEMSYNDTTDDLTWTTAAAAAGIAIEIGVDSAMESGKAGLDGAVIQLVNA